MAFQNDETFEDDFRKAGADATATLEPAGTKSNPTEFANSESLSSAAAEDDDLEEDEDLEDDEDVDGEDEDDEDDLEDDEVEDEDDAEDDLEDDEDEDDDEEDEDDEGAGRGRRGSCGSSAAGGDYGSQRAVVDLSCSCKREGAALVAPSFTFRLCGLSH